MAPPQAARDISDMKFAQRAVAADIRAEVHDRSKQSAGARLAQIGLDFLQLGPGAIVSGYCPFRTEIDVMPLLKRLDREGIELALPVVVRDDQPLLFRCWRAGDALESGRLNIPVPPIDAPELEPDVLLVPLLAFDSRGYRLGYGGGFYDRTLERLRARRSITAVGVAYAGQKVGTVVRGIEDQPVDWVLTEDGPMGPVRAPAT